MVVVYSFGPMQFRHSDWLQEIRDPITSVIFLLQSLHHRLVPTSATRASCTYVLILKRVVCLPLKYMTLGSRDLTLTDT